MFHFLFTDFFTWERSEAGPFLEIVFLVKNRGILSAIKGDFVKGLVFYPGLA